MHNYKGKWNTNKCPFVYKDELVEWACETWPNEKPSKFKSMKMSQLFALWYYYKPKPKIKRDLNERK